MMKLRTLIKLVSVLILVIHFTGCAEMDTKEDISGPGNNAADVESTPSKLKIIDKQRFIEKGFLHLLEPITRRI